jgi:HSP20 family protein
MTNITRRDPFEFVPVGRIVQSLFNDPFFASFGGEHAPIARGIEEGTLPLDISEDDKSVIVRASVPGFRREDVEVEVHDGVLSIKAQHSEEKEEKNERFYRKERRVGSMSRRVALPSMVVGDEAAAELNDGVLTVRVPKTKQATPVKVKIG